MKKIILITNILISFSSFSNVHSGCGEFVFRGMLQKDLTNQFKVKYVVLEKTKNESVFHLEKMEELTKLLPYLEQFTEIKVNVLKEFEGTKGVIASVNEIKLAVPNPLNMESDFVLVKKLDCVKN